MGTGRGATDNDDDDLMWMTRWQWNPMGEPVGFAGSDISRSNKFIMSIVVAGVTNESPYTREDAKKAVLKTLNSVLDESIEDCLYQDASGKICMEVNTTLDIEHSLGIPTGNIFHTPLDWPWAMESDQVGKWGVETTHRSVFLCGSGAARGGGVSGIPGHNAAHAILTGEIGYGGQGAQM